MRITLIGEMDSYDQKVRVTYYRQEDGHYFALRTDRAAQSRGEKDFLSEHRDMDQAELMAMIASMVPVLV